MLLREEIEVLTAGQRAVGVGFLAPGGRLHHVVAHEAEQLVDLDIGRGDALRERHREQRIAAFAVKRDWPCLAA